MAWTEITRHQYVQAGRRNASDLTDAEWAVLEPLMPPPSPIGRSARTDLRVVMDAILYMASTGCQWPQLPKDFPPYSTVQGYFYECSRDGTFGLRAALKRMGRWKVEIIKRPDAVKGFELLPRRWVVENIYA